MIFHWVFQILFMGVLVQLRADDLLENTRVDIIEKNEYKYVIDIHKSLKLQTDQSKQSKTDQKEEILVIKNKFGQSYECNIPKFDDSVDSDEDVLDEKKRGPSYDFTEIDERIKKEMDILAKSKICIYRSLGWWTYEFCFGSHASQYHMLNNGTIEGEIINLGNYTNDFNWLKAEENNLPISSGVLYHEQNFDMGTICEISQKPRKGVAKIFCGEYSTNEIELISEVETCVYEIHIYSGYLCSIPNFREKKNKFDINCNPIVDEIAFNDYQAKRQKAIQENELKLKTKVDKKFNDINKASTVIKNAKAHIKQVETASQANHEEKVNKDTRKQESKLLFDETMIKDLKAAMKIPGKDDEKIFDLENINNLDLNDLEKINKILLENNKALLKDLRKRAQVSKQTANLDSMLNKIEKYFDELKKRPDLEKMQIESNELDTKSDAAINDHIKKLQDEFEGQEKKNYKIKVIKLDPNNPNLDSDDFSTLLSSLMKDSADSKNIERIKSNYNYVYDKAQDATDFEDNTQIEVQQKISSNKNDNVKVEHIDLANWLNSKESSQNSAEDDADSLIIY